uniref:Serpin-2 n=1 Tax=Dermanyssus gallinae TaxID=34641 RepID=A0A0M4FEI6_9ACAR|nr:serpin-2 [Dermanyssus gallinae]
MVLFVAGLFVGPPAHVEAAAVEAKAVDDASVEPSDAERQLWTAVGHFGHELLKQSSKGHGPYPNLLISPLSVHSTLSMAFEGSRGSTRNEMLEALKLKALEPEAIWRAYSALTSRKHENNTKPGDYFSDVQFIMRLANRMYLSKGYPIDPSYVDQLKTTYHADAVNVDFAAEGPAVQKQINEFVRERTNNLIPQILPSPLAASTVLALVNSVYFKGDWTEAMTEKNQVMLFNKDSKVHQQEYSNWLNTEHNMPYLESAALRAKLIRIPYKSSKYSASMLIIVPEDPLCDGNQWLHDVKWTDIQQELSKMRMTRVNLTMPRFEVGARLQLENTLPSMGMPSAFDTATSDLSGMVTDKGQRLSIDQVIHQTKMTVTKYGTEAAAATVLTVMLTSYQIPTEPITMVVDRAFYFAILYGTYDAADVMPLFNGVIYKM